MSSSAKIYEALEKIFCRVFLRDDIVLVPKLTALDVQGWDSFKQIEIILSVEEAFNIELSPKDLDGLHCVDNIVAVIQRLGKISE